MSVSPEVTFSPVVQGSGLRDVKVLLGPGAPVIETGGGWAVITRPKKKGFTAWEGFEPEQMTLNLMFDGLTRSEPQQPEYDALNRIMRTRVGPSNQPSEVRLTGPVPGTSNLWVIQSIQPDSNSVIRRNEDGELLRVSADVVLVEYIKADVLISTSPSPAERATPEATSTPSGRTHTVVFGDTLSRIAVKYLGSWSRYTEIAELNDIRDANNVPVGTVLKIP